MKNMKKILAVGALLTLGTMAMGASTLGDGLGKKANADFDVKLNVVSPISIENNQDVDFGSLTTKEIERGNNVAEGRFTVTADDRYSFTFEVAGDTLVNKDNENAKINFGTEITGMSSESLAGDINTVNGELKGKLIVTLAQPSTTVEAGEYSGKVNIAVAYN